MIKNIYFDLDGTIIDSAPSIITGLKITLEKYGYDIPDYATLRKCVGPPFTYSFPNYLGIRDEDFADAVATYRHYYDKENGCMDVEAFEGVEGLLAALVKRGYCLFVCTSKPEPTARKILEGLGLAKYFTDICGATLDAKINTKEQVINLCFSRAPWHLKEETILIGDTKFDVDGAKASGIECIGVSWGFGSTDEMLEHGALEVFDYPDEVLDYIESN
ncbi:HAD hydrolase-like protein [Pseudobutyrivibrio xylanivorans]|uniref:Phosphoglycolate phosphatase n=1 Tax=Pseudobutyrivibrio xylanivorans TaxID=185007 RepID=A0A1G5RY76_PSEXY|nr:HAD hydrolase-like protein [Pseudobutyrivibrio xylanivorans]SCZ78279.1 phosphoglycolate phosphatase [Pseudobutyrivibrio xylanivorans]